MKEVSFHASVAGCSTHDFYQFACSEPTALEQFHREVNKDDTVEVNWVDQDKSARMCTYTLATPIPSALQSFVGAGPIRVKEKQVFTWLDEHTLKIASRPMVQITYGRALKTDAEMLLSPTPEGCYMEVKVKVTAALPWAMQYLASTIEALMAAEAKRTVGQYVDFITKYVESSMNNLQLRQQELAQQQLESDLQQAQQLALDDMQQQQQDLGLDLAMSEQSGGSEPGAEVVIIHSEEHHTLGLVPSLEAKPAVAAAADSTAVQGALSATQPPVAAAATSYVQRAASSGTGVHASMQQVLSSGELDVFYDASELGRAEVLEVLMKELQRELRAAKEQRQDANRLLSDIKGSMQRVEQTISKEVAFQEGVRFAQRNSNNTLLLSVASTALVASAATALILMRRNGSK